MATPKNTPNPETPEVANAPEVVEAPRTKRVIIQRPVGNKDMGQFLGFNETSGMYPFDTPIDMPADMVTFWRSQKTATTYPGEDGRPITTYTAQFNIVDAE